MMADDTRSGLTLLDGVLLVAAGIIELFVVFALFHFIVGLVWFAVKVVLVLAVIGAVLWVLFRRRS